MSKLAIKITIDDRAFRRAMKRNPAVMFAETRDGLERGVAGFRKEWMQKVRSTRLKRSLRWMFVGYTKGRAPNLDTLEARIHPRKFHQSLALLEGGGVVRPEKGSKLAIPLAPIRKRGGKGSPRRGMATPTLWRRRFKGRKLVEIGSTLVEFKKVGGKRRGKWAPVQGVFLLRAFVRVRAILKLRSAWRSGRKKFVERVNSNVRRGLKKVFGAGAVRAR